MMLFEDVKFALIYFISDRDFSIYAIKDVIGFNMEEFGKLENRVKVMLQAEYNCILEKVRIVQVASDKELLKETSLFCSNLKKQKIKLETMIHYFEPLRGIDRQRLPPIYKVLMDCGIESSTEYSSNEAAAPAIKPTEHEAQQLLHSCHSDIELPPITNSPGLSMVGLRQKVITQGSPTVPTLASPLLQRVSNIAQCPSTSTSIRSDSGRKPPLENKNDGILSRYRNLANVAETQGININSTQAILFFLSELLYENSLLRSEMVELKREVTRLSGRVNVRVAEPVEFETPIFQEENHYREIENHPDPVKLRQWMKRLGGSDFKDHVRRCMNGLLSVELQRKINRTGVDDKMAFHKSLESQLIAATCSLFPDVTKSNIEKYIAAFLTGARDRCGGKKERLQKTNRPQNPNLSNVDRIYNRSKRSSAAAELSSDSEG